ncbi:hypothetical protein Rs2_02487 [Raphanus sativus]|nr:hypothetical protein Rs2_02487 [Raphanus sativus]
MRPSVWQGNGRSTIKRLAGLPPPQKFACSVSGRPETCAVLENSWESTCPFLILRSASYSRASLSASEGENKNRGMKGSTRKSYATVEEMTKISIAGASAINGGRRKSLGGRGRRTLLCGGGGRSWFI